MRARAVPALNGKRKVPVLAKEMSLFWRRVPPAGPPLAGHPH